MMDTHAVLLIATITVVTVSLRFLPFLIFSGGRKTPEFVTWLGKVLPYAIIGMLVVYCLKNVSLISAPFGAPEFLACFIVILLHIWKRNSLLSIGGGTLCYMLLVQFIF